MLNDIQTIESHKYLFIIDRINKSGKFPTFLPKIKAFFVNCYTCGIVMKFEVNKVGRK